MTEKTAQEIKVSPHFFLRRLHSLTGVFPIGAFLLEHMFSNSFIIKGPEAYNNQINFLLSLPYVEAIEILFIFLPILYHAFYGFYVMFTGKNNLGWYPNKENWLYAAQRWTGIMTFAYVGYHVYHTKITHIMYGTEVSYARMETLMQDPFNFWFYIVGLAAVMFHFANGIWGFLISWGITVGTGARRVSGWICTLVGITLYYWGVNALLHLVK
jgi:succinate dehydrogenase / fumarate reductase, cytochrome b subunit